MYISLMVFVLVGIRAPANAKDGCSGECNSCHSLSIKEAQELLTKTGGTVRSVKQAPVKGMFELLMEKDGKQGLVYIDYSKKYLVQGFIVDFENLHTVAAHTDELPKLTPPAAIDLKNIPAKNAVIMGNPKSENKIYVFTDPDCPYCRKMHGELKKLVKLVPDLAIYVMLYPLPAHPEAYDKSRALVTFKKQDVLDKAFAGGALPVIGTKDGVSEINEIINYARRNGITATPSVVLQNGTLVTGFKTAEELTAILKGK
jgi:thiol:disulfide interchange protein DsbC